MNKKRYQISKKLDHLYFSVNLWILMHRNCKWPEKNQIWPTFLGSKSSAITSLAWLQNWVRINFSHQGPGAINQYIDWVHLQLSEKFKFFRTQCFLYQLSSPLPLNQTDQHANDFLYSCFGLESCRSDWYVFVIDLFTFCKVESCSLKSWTTFEVCSFSFQIREHFWVSTLSSHVEKFISRKNLTRFVQKELFARFLHVNVTLAWILAGSSRHFISCKELTGMIQEIYLSGKILQGMYFCSTRTDN